jgi:UDP-N-acetylglucosamine 2-epimerase (non-hydrolysing)
MKVAPLHKAFTRQGSIFESSIVHTGQHYDEKMSKIFFDDLELPVPDVYLGVGSGSHAEQTAKIMVEFEKILKEAQPDCVLVVGDVNSTLACSVVAAKMHFPVVHVEAGLRSFDRKMPEEINRIVTDSISDMLFVTEQSGVDNLLDEGVDEDKIHLVGNVMIDSLVHYKEKAAASTVLADLGLAPEAYMLVTLHRPSNVDNEESLRKIVEFFETFTSRVDILFPVHPRTKKMLDDFGLLSRLRDRKGFHLVDPLGYLDFLHLLGSAKIVLTDSGGIQEETTYLGVPCVTIRDNTERPITVEVGTNILSGSDIGNAHRWVEAILDGKAKRGAVPELWDGKAAERIATVLRDTVL